MIKVIKEIIAVVFFLVAWFVGTCIMAGSGDNLTDIRRGIGLICIILCLSFFRLFELIYEKDKKNG